MDATPKISVIIPTYNRASMACECVTIVLATEWPNLEMFMVNDCAPENTVDEVKRYFGPDQRVRYLRNAHISYKAASRNNDAEVAKGEYFFTRVSTRSLSVSQMHSTSAQGKSTGDNQPFGVFDDNCIRL